MGIETSWSQEIKHYAHQHSRQTLSISQRTSQTDGTTVIYIHGGAWRDHRQSHADFNPAISILQTHPKHATTLSQISKFVSIDYGLSPYPGQPTQDPARNLTHPQHLEDIAKAMQWLKLDETVTENFILVGHSCGATLAFQVVRKLALRPKATVGLAGIYDMPKFVEDERPSPEMYEIYRQIVVGAFGSDRTVWEEASPALWSAAVLRETLEGVKVVVGHSLADEMLKIGQSEGMVRRMEADGMPVARFLRFEGSGHDEMWQKGEDVAEGIVVALEVVGES